MRMGLRGPHIHINVGSGGIFYRGGGIFTWYWIESPSKVGITPDTRKKVSSCNGGSLLDGTGLAGTWLALAWMSNVPSECIVSLDS